MNRQSGIAGDPIANRYEIRLLGKNGADREKSWTESCTAYQWAMDYRVSMPAMQGATGWIDACCNCSAESRCRRWKAGFTIEGGNACVRVAREIARRSADRPCIIAGSKKILVSRGSRMAAFMCSRLRKPHAVGSSRWDEAERSRARVVCVDAPVLEN